LYKKEDPEQFKLDIMEVTVDGGVPVGIGEWKEVIDESTRIRTTPGPSRRSPLGTRNMILIDPMTGETISKEPVLDREGKQVLDRSSGQPAYKVNDHWFVLNAKFLWPDAPEQPKQTVTSPYGVMSPQRPTTSPSSGSSSKSKLPDLDM
jgi:hypothetical protein